MSADAKIWQDDESDSNRSGWTSWRGLHDGACHCGGEDYHKQGNTLLDVITGIEHCMGSQLRWEFRAYPDGKVGLVGYTW